MTSRAATKDELRAGLVAARRARSPASLTSARDAVRAHALALARSRAARCVAAYEPWRTEPGSPELLAGLATTGSRVLVPHTRDDRDLDWRAWPHDLLLGVQAITAAELIFVPALAVAADGARLGRGRGSYDRALNRRSGSAQVWALVFDDEVLDALPSDPWDVPVTGAITPGGSLELGRNTGRDLPR